MNPKGISPAVCECHGEVTRVVIQKVGDRGTDNYSAHDYSNTISANPMSNRGQLLVEPKIIGFSRDEKGKVVGHHFKDEANTLTQGGGSTMIYVAEPRVTSVGNRNPSGHGIGGEVYDSDGLSPTLCVNKGSGYTIAEPLRVRQATAQGYIERPPYGGFDAAYPASEVRRGRVQDGGNVVGAITSQSDSHCVYEGPQNNQIKMQQPKYRIRKLTPVETGRLMGMDDTDIHKMLDPKDDKGKPIISKSQAYKLHGNSIVVDVLYHIFRKAFVDTATSTPEQLQLF